MSCRRFATLLLSLAGILILAPTAQAQISRGHQLLMQRGLQTQGMVTKDDNFHIDTYQNGNYSTVNWLWEASFAQLGPQPNYPWARWVNDESSMPFGAELSHLNSLVALQLGDEWDLNN